MGCGSRRHCVSQMIYHTGVGVGEVVVSVSDLLGYSMGIPWNILCDILWDIRGRRVVLFEPHS
jgi:hypothetical protein